MMKKLLFILFAFVFILNMFVISALADQQTLTSIASVKISDGLDKIEIECTLSPKHISSDGKIYLLRVPASGDTVSMTVPVAYADANSETIRFICGFDPNITEDLLCGYCIAKKDGENYTTISDVKYIDNPDILAHNVKEYPNSISKKGLSVQYLYDAQSLGVKHTVVNADLGSLISTGADGDNTVNFPCNGEIYSLSKPALSSLDHIIKSFTDAGIHIYMNLIFSYNADLNERLYPGDIPQTSGILFQPNVTDPVSRKTVYAVLSFLSERYSSDNGEYGFCGSYIIGYQVNEITSNFNGYSDENYIKSYSDYLRLCNISLKSGYKYSRCFVSLSGVCGDARPEKNDVIGCMDFLSSLAGYAGDLPFSVAVNPHICAHDPEKTNNRSNIDYLTIDNIDILTDFLSESSMMFAGRIRNVIISEYATDGKIGDISEKEQAASFLKAYFDACKNEVIESMIWSQHVDGKNGELHFSGLYSSADISFTANERKDIYDVFAAVDDRNADIGRLIETLSQYFPAEERKTICDFYLDGNNKTQIVINQSNKKSLNSVKYTQKLKLDFSKNLYNFYPTFNSNYIEQHSDDETKYMRMCLNDVSYFEYSGGTYYIKDTGILSDCDTMTVHTRLVSNNSRGKVRIVLTGIGDGTETVLNCDADVENGKWNDLTFRIDEFTKNDFDNCRIEILGLTGKYGESEIFLDVSSLEFGTDEKTRIPIVVLASVITVFTITGIFVLTSPLIKHKQNKQ